MFLSGIGSVVRDCSTRVDGRSNTKYESENNFEFIKLQYVDLILKITITSANRRR